MHDHWQEFEEFMRNHIGEDKPHPRHGAQPDAVKASPIVIGGVVYEAKHKQYVTRGDIDKLLRDIGAHLARCGVLYISSETNISDDVLRYSNEYSITVIKLHWNGHVEELRPPHWWQSLGR
jgi:hypothetical protein